MNKIGQILAIFVQTAALSGEVFHLMRNFSRFWHRTAQNKSVQTWDLQVFALHSINGEVELTLAQWTSLRSPPWHTATHRSQWKSALTGGALPRDSTADKGEDVHETDGGETKISVGSYKVNMVKIFCFIHFSWNEVSHQYKKGPFHLANPGVLFTPIYIILCIYIVVVEKYEL